MKKKTKKIWLGLLVPAISIPVVALCSFNSGISSVNKNNDNNNSIYGNEEFKYLFNNKYYDSLDDITDELLNNNKYINSELYYGNAKDAVFDQESERVNINQLREFDSSRISSAYLNAFGAHEQDFNKAKKSFVNEGLVKYKYQDTNGKLHSSFSEAKREILKGVKVDEAVFHKIKDIGDVADKKEYKINPLNKDDIKLMKEIAINNAKKSINNVTSTPFGIKPMIKNNDKSEISKDNFTNLKNIDELLSINEIFSERSIDNLFNDVYTKIKNEYNKIIDKIWKNSKFKAELSFQYASGDEKKLTPNYNISFDIKNIKTNNDMKIYRTLGPIVDKKRVNKVTSVDFHNINYEHLNNFNVFLNRNTWNKQLFGNAKVVRTTQQTGWVGFERDLADTLTFTNFLDNSFEIFSNGNDGSKGNGQDHIWGINVQILHPGKWDQTQLYFDVKFSLENETLFFKEIYNQISTIFNHNNNNNQSKEKDLNNTLKGNIITSFNTELYNYITTKNYFNEKYSKYNKGISSVDNLNFVFNKIKNVLEDVNNPDNEFKNQYKANFIDKLLKIYNDNSISHFLTYNNMPIFQINKQIEFENDEIDITNKFYKSYLSKSIFNQKTNNLSDFKNISTLISKDGEIIKDKFIDIKMENGYFKIPKNITEYQGQLNNNAGGAPIVNSNGFYYALNSYNKNLEYLNKKYSNNLPEEIKKKLINNIEENVLVLRDLSEPNFTLNSYFGKFISLLYDFNEPLSSNEILIYDKITLQTSIEASNNIDPAKVIVIYDLSGNIVNPGISIGDDLVMQTTSDAMYDSERTILDNIYRTLIVKKDPNKVFYKNENGTHTLLDYQTNFVFELSYNKKDHYFLSYEKARLYLRDIISLEAQKVNIRGDKNEIN
ncbi:MAG: hypothetical protein ACRDA7_00360 [Metamycoplasmataceae bacterium]